MHRGGRLRLHRQARQQRAPAVDVESLADKVKPARGMASQIDPAGPSLEDIEIRLLLEGVALHYGYDFRDYAQSPLRRNIVMSVALEGVPTISRYQERLLHDAECMERFLNAV